VTLEATLDAETFPTRFEEFRFEIAEPFPESKFVCKIPETVRLVKVPTEVMLGWAGFVTLEATLDAETFPTRFEEFRFEIAEPFPESKFVCKIPETVRLVKVPTEVMLG
jgi:hypothetical protein